MVIQRQGQTRGEITEVMASSLVEVVPLPPSTGTNAIVVAIHSMPWDDPHYIFDPKHLAHCASLLQKAAVAFWEAPQSSAQAERVQELEAQVTNNMQNLLKV